MKIVKVTYLNPWTIQITDTFGSDLLKVLYYVAKLDHLLCVPAIVFLYLGLKRLLETKVSDPAWQKEEAE